jgi:hypothetical protein
VTNSILKNTGANCTSIIANGSDYNIVSDGTCTSLFTGAHNIFSTDPLLGPLQDNGGPTFTHALPVNSPAIDTIPAANHCGTGSTTVDTDQRGTTRQFAATCDMGAVEFAFTSYPNSGPGAGGSKVTLSGAGFVSGMTVALGGSNCTNVTVNGTGTNATCTTTAHAAGTVAVSVTYSGQTRTLASAYTYGPEAVMPGGAPQGSPVGSPAVLPGRGPTGTGQGAPAPLPNPRP